MKQNPEIKEKAINLKQEAQLFSDEKIIEKIVQLLKAKPRSYIELVYIFIAS